MGESEELAYSQFSSFRELEQCIQEVLGFDFLCVFQPSIFTPLTIASSMGKNRSRGCTLPPLCLPERPLSRSRYAQPNGCWLIRKKAD
jgi:hypothetical protein